MSLDFTDPMAGVAAIVFAVVLVVLIDNVIARLRGPRNDDDG